MLKMPDIKIEMIDVSLDIENSASGIHHILEIIKSDWKKDDIEIEVIIIAMLHDMLSE